PGRSNRLDTAIHHGYARAEQYQSIPSLPPSSRQRRLNHKMLVLLNNFRIGLLAMMARNR
ncbi:hypothetical protein, partial [Erythrobacter sp. QSSC1-22B]|uniref:hypothetical protein n=1 Tax=Erythrobacter sp. QSSC1-22B TaxID=1860125 RepID=UPI001F1FB716